MWGGGAYAAYYDPDPLWFIGSCNEAAEVGARLFARGEVATVATTASAAENSIVARYDDMRG